MNLLKKALVCAAMLGCMQHNGNAMNLGTKVVLGTAVAAGIGGIASYYLYPTRFPTPTGSFGVGTVKHFLRHADSPDLTVQFWYPTDNKLQKASVPWSSDFVTAIKKAYPSARLLIGCNRILTHAEPCAPITQSQDSYPVIIYSHGLPGYPGENLSLCEGLASHGYIVAGIGHPCEEYRKKARGPLSFDENQVLSNQEAERWIVDAQRVLDYLEQINVQPVDNRFYDKLDLHNVGMAGHSFGGSTAIQLCRRDKRCKAGVNMDGFLYGAQPTAPFKKPIMFLLSSELAGLRSLPKERIIQAFQTQENYEKACNSDRGDFAAIADAIGKDVYKIVIKDTQHNAFVDTALLRDCSIFTRFFDLNTGPLNSYRAHEIMNAYVCAFFDKYLKNEQPALLDEQQARYPEVEMQRWG